MGLEWLIQTIIALAVVGFLVWLVLQVTMPQIFKNVIIALAVLALVLWAVRNVLPRVLHG